MRVAIINYGIGNIGSVHRAFEDLGADIVIVSSPGEITNVNAIVLPGVGTFSQGMELLNKEGWPDAINMAVRSDNISFLGICLGMQLLADYGYEGGETPGLGLLPGSVRRLDVLGCDLRIPHVGWNEVVHEEQDTLFRHIPNGSDYYFVHSYGFVPNDRHHVVATVPYGVDIPAVVRWRNVVGCQFHPEKSSKVGRQLLRNFLDQCAC